jgi:DNA-binding MarR family transcriptional regulator
MKFEEISNIGDLFFEFQAKLQFFERIFLKTHAITDVTPNEVKVLYIIGLSNNKSMREIAEKLKVTQGTLSITVNSLVKKGYVIRTRNKFDKRIIILYLTKQSINVIKMYGTFYFELISKLFDVFDDDKVNVLKEILIVLNQNLETDYGEGHEDDE